MADGIYVTMNGAAARSEQLDAIADNLANAQTPGFKAARPAFEAFFPASGAEDKAYPAAVATGFDLRPGPTTRTDAPLDVLPEDGAFLAVAAPGGGVAYTRDGRLSVDSERRLATATGRLVLDRSGAPIRVPPGPPPQVGQDGVIRSGDTAIAELARVKLDGPVDRIGPSLLAPAPGGRALPSDAKVRTGEVELGNSGALEGMVQLISAQRHFDASMQALQTYRSLDQRSAETGRVR
ncbi:flagellar hook basal-body protein [Anaeromyxobacter diazotrophicus]|uniref:Flagellar basal-body rod protein FlgF n=1 Tax=Anaeromyxobacter diazotrophicus TaxID=2590199 RepID=A0A7I9VRW4_9BACT|nr:flagellar hook basal-body protein [Anaeromyxobacter diazotrophicus]GEJ59184.1 flagellar basal-body rod protein FlgF [Anaeromyxobacter diazotrophicus]